MVNHLGCRPPRVLRDRESSHVCPACGSSLIDPREPAHFGSALDAPNDRGSAQGPDSAADPNRSWAFHRRLAARIGKPQAITATARNLAILVYRGLKGDLVYRDPGPDAYDAQQRTRILRGLRQRAATLGFDLINRGTGEILVAGVS